MDLAGQNNISFGELIDSLSIRHQTYFSYNQSLVESLYVQEINCDSLESCLEYLKEDFWLEAVKQPDGGFLLKPIRNPLTFKLVDEQSNQTVEMIRIAINGSDESYHFAHDDTYTIKSLYLTDSLQFASRFYNAKSVRVKDLNNAEGMVISITPSEVLLDEVVIEDYLFRGIDQNLKTQTFEIQINQLGLVAGAGDADILNMLSKIPGVRTPDGKPGNLNMRGSSFDQNLILLDNIPIYHTGHFLGTISPYNPLAVSSAKVNRGTLQARRGGRVGGLIDLSTQKETPLDSSSYSVTLSGVYSSAKADIPLKKGKTELLVAFRTKTPGSLFTPRLKAYQLLNFQGSRQDPNFLDDKNKLSQFDLWFHDMNGRISHRWSENHTSELSALNIQNNLDIASTLDRDQKVESQTVDLINRGYSFFNKIVFNQKLTLLSSITQSSFRLKDLEETRLKDTLTNKKFSRHSVDDFQGLTEIEVKLTDKTTLKSGYQLMHNVVKFGDGAAKNETDKSMLHSFYVSSSHMLNEDLVMTAGARLEHYSIQKKIRIDPRVHLSYAASPHFFIKASYGHTHQYLRQLQRKDFNDFRVRNQIWMLTRGNDPVFSTKLGVLGFLIDKDGWQFDTEFYLKNTEGLIRQVSPTSNEFGESRVIGVDIFSMKRWNSWETWISYSLSSIKEIYNLEKQSFIDQRHIFNWTGQFSKNRWTTALSWRFLSGMPVVPSTDANFSLPYLGRFPAQHQLDLSVTMKFWYKQDTHRAIAGFSLLNLYDRKNIINAFQNNPRAEIPVRYAIGFAPNLSLQINF